MLSFCRATNVIPVIARVAKGIMLRTQATAADVQNTFQGLEKI